MRGNAKFLKLLEKPRKKHQKRLPYYHWIDGCCTEYVFGPSIFFIFCGYIDEVYTYLNTY